MTTDIKLRSGMTFTDTKGRKVVILRTLPGGRVEMGRYMTGPIPAGLSGIVSEWQATHQTVRCAIANGSYIPAI